MRTMRTAGWPCTACPGWPPECWERQGPRCKEQMRNVGEFLKLSVEISHQRSQGGGTRVAEVREGGRKREPSQVKNWKSN